MTSTLVSGSRPELDTFLTIYSDLAHRAATGNYIYRGEHKTYDRISSSLYRRHRKKDEDGLGTQAIQEEMLKQARQHAPLMSDPDDDNAILAELRHNGGETNVIDFTRNYLVALFFACDGAPYKVGQVHFLPELGNDYTIFEPLEPIQRTTVQKSVLVEPQKGFVQPAMTVKIGAAEKAPVLEQLRILHGISAETTYNDLYGLIQHQEIHRKAYTRLYQGVTLAGGGEFQPAVEQYTKCIRRNPEMRAAYRRRAEAYHELKEYDNAIRDFQKTLTFNTQDDEVHQNLGTSYLEHKRYAEAIAEFNQAWLIWQDDSTLYFRFETLLGMEKWEEAKEVTTQTDDSEIGTTWETITDLMKTRHENVSGLELHHGIRLPDDIADLLGGR